MSTHERLLGDLFDGVCRKKDKKFEIEGPQKPVNLASLLEACRILECAPEQIYFNADYEPPGCSTCGDYGQSVLVIEVIR